MRGERLSRDKDRREKGKERMRESKDGVDSKRYGERERQTII